jgi:hypothetical protein
MCIKPLINSLTKNIDQNDVQLKKKVKKVKKNKICPYFRLPLNPPIVF